MEKNTVRGARRERRLGSSGSRKGEDCEGRCEVQQEFRFRRLQFLMVNRGIWVVNCG